MESFLLDTLLAKIAKQKELGWLASAQVAPPQFPHPGLWGRRGRLPCEFCLCRKVWVK